MNRRKYLTIVVKDRGVRWPRAQWHVLELTSHGVKRIAGGFYTRNGAQRWLDKELTYNP